MSRFILAPQAAADIERILSYIERDNPTAADRLQSRLWEAFRRLAEFPDAGHARKDLVGDRPILFWPVGRYLILYRGRSGAVEIVAVLHGSRDIPAVLRERDAEE